MLLPGINLFIEQISYAGIFTWLAFICLGLMAPAYAGFFTNDLDIPFTQVRLSGSGTLSYNYNDVSGSKSYFNDYNYGANSPWTANSSISANGDLLPRLQLNARFDVNPTRKDFSNWSLRYSGHDETVQIGQIPANLGGNDFVLLNRTLRGIQVDAVLPRGTFTAISSELKAPVHTDTFYGQNINGPYYLTNAPVVSGTEIVLLDGIQQRSPTDYRLDAYNGILTFAPSIIVAPTVRVTVSYEVATSGVGGGKLYAIRSTYPLAKNLTAGFSYLELVGHPTGAGVELKEDHYKGGSTAGPYYVTYRPVIAGSEEVVVNGLLRPRNTYTFDYAAGQIFFNNLPPDYPIPNTDATIVVRYNIEVPAQNNSGRVITGLDMNWKDPRGYSLNLQTAQSSGGASQDIPAQQITDEPFFVRMDMLPTAQVFTLQHTPIQPGTVRVRAGALYLTSDQFVVNTTTGELRLLRDDIPISIIGPTLFVSYSTQAQTVSQSGNSALSLAGTAVAGKLNISARYKQLDPGFAPLDMVGFQRVNRSLDWQSNYAFSPYLRFSTSGVSSRQPYNSYATGVTNQPIVNEENRTFALDYNRPLAPQISFRRTTRASTQEGDLPVGSTNTNDSLNVNWSRGTLATSLSLSRVASDSRTPRANGAGGTAGIYQLTNVTDNGSINLTYSPNTRLTLGTLLTANIITPDGDDTRATHGANTQVTARYQANDRLSFDANMQNSSTGATRNAQGNLVDAQTNKGSSLTGNWRPTDKMNVGLTYSTNRAEGGYNSNSSQEGYNANLWWQPSAIINFTGNWSHQQTKYLHDASNAQMDLVGISSEYRGLGKAVMTLNLQNSWGESTLGVSSEGMTKTLNKQTTVSGRVSYPINERQNVFVTGEDMRDNGSPSSNERTSVGLGWDYRLNNNLTLTLDSQRTMYNDNHNPTLNYNANTVNAHLGVRF